MWELTNRTRDLSREVQATVESWSCKLRSEEFDSQGKWPLSFGEADDAGRDTKGSVLDLVQGLVPNHLAWMQ